VNIGLLIYGTLDRLTGGTLYDRFLVDALRTRGHRVRVVSLPGRSWMGGIAHGPRVAQQLPAMVQGLDLLLQDGLCHPCLPFATRRLHGLAPSMTQVALIHQLRSAQPGNAVLRCIARPVEIDFCRRADAVIFNSRFSREHARGFLRPRVPVCIAPPGGDRLVSGPFRPPSPPHESEPLRLLFTGNVTPIKGLPALLAALADYPMSHWRLRVVGRTDLARGHMRQVDRILAQGGLHRNVTFAGPLDGEPLRAAYRASHLLAMPFAHESFGIAVLEAMGFGLPVLASTGGAAAALVRHGENGLLTAPGDRAAVRTHLDRLRRDPAEWRAMSAAARRTFEAQPTWAESMGNACAFLEGLSARREG
jgi:glycosyltransferase involved in cell wall biosynthesis